MYDLFMASFFASIFQQNYHCIWVDKLLYFFVQFESRSMENSLRIFECHWAAQWLVDCGCCGHSSWGWRASLKVNWSNPIYLIQVELILCGRKCNISDLVWFSEEVRGCLYLLLVGFFSRTVHLGAAESYSRHWLSWWIISCSVCVDDKVMHFK